MKQLILFLILGFALAYSVKADNNDVALYYTNTFCISCKGEGGDCHTHKDTVFVKAGSDIDDIAEYCIMTIQRVFAENESSANCKLKGIFELSDGKKKALYRYTDSKIYYFE